MKTLKIKGGGLAVEDFSKLFESKTSINYLQNESLFSKNMRCLICGPSNSGKTNLVISLLLHKNGIRFQNVYVYSKTMFQPKYTFLKKVMEGVTDIINFYAFSDGDNIISSDKVLPFSVIIFDDISFTPKNLEKIKEYFRFGRHSSINLFFLCQTYTSVPKQLIRDNANYLCLFKQDLNNLKHIYFDHIHPDISFSQFCELCNECWKDKHGFITIVKENDLNNGRFRKTFDKYIKVQ